MADLLHVSSDGEQPVALSGPGIGAVHVFEVVPDYEFAAPGGARWLVLHDVKPGDTTGFAAPRGSVAILFNQISPAEGWLTAAGETAGPVPTGTAVLSVIMDVDEDALTAFHGWYEEEHLPSMVAVPGILGARRFAATAGGPPDPGRRRFLALYEVAGREVFAGEAWAAVSTITPRTQEVLPHLSWASQLYRRVE
jgi:hypothetical protein